MIQNSDQPCNVVRPCDWTITQVSGYDCPNAATAYVTTLHEAGVAISMVQVGQQTQNGYAECLMRTIKERHVDLTEYVDYHDASPQIGRFLR